MNKAKKGKFKSFIFKVFGKARWFLIAIAVFVAIYLFLEFTSEGDTKLVSVTDSYSGEDYVVDNSTGGSVNDEGYASFFFTKDDIPLLGIVNLNTKEQVVAGAPYVKMGEYYYVPHIITMGEGQKYYGLCIDYGGDYDSAVTKEAIVAYNKDFKSAQKIFEIQYDLSDKIRYAQISKLNYYNGELTFAVVGKDETRLYSIDTETQNVRMSDPYRADENGNYVVEAIPLDGSFLFILSDGEVYQQKFGEPLENLIFTFKASAYDIDRDQSFDDATLAGGKIYVCRRDKTGKVFCLENKKLTEVLDLTGPEYKGDQRVIWGIDSYRSGDKDLLYIATGNGIVLFDGTEKTDPGIVVFLKNHIYVDLESILEIAIFVMLCALVVNLIIRRKTLMYKQILVTLPVIIIPAVLLSMNLYSDIQEDNIARTRQDVDQVCRMATSAFNGYDFSAFDELNKDIGVESRKVFDMLQSFDTVDGNYVFSIVHRIDDNHATVLCISDRVSNPLYLLGSFKTAEEMEGARTDDGFYRFDELSGVIDDDADSNRIYAYGAIKDAKGTGDYYMRVQTNSWNFWVLRRDWFAEIVKFVLIIIVALAAVTVLTSLIIARTIKKATTTVSKIADGDFSARIKYKSKDELGEICSQVNTMANSLETMFDEKDRTEKFYYKFVPEQFRKFLNKENFTDLQLGDARSRELTVLFCDIRSFSINSEIMTAKETFEFINKVYGMAGPIVRQNNGFVDKYIGDAVMALFESADDAVKCGIEMYKAIALDPAMAESLGVSAINIGIGIHSGMSMVGIVGETERLSGTVISDTVNLSSRLESLTKQFKTGMLISKDSVDRLSDAEAYDLRYLGILQVAGVNEVKGVYEVLDCLPADIREARSSHKNDLREAIRLFHMGERDEAVKMLSGIDASEETDGVIKKYADYISEMSDEERGNVFRFTRK